MADLPPYSDSNGDASGEPDRESTTGTPRWVAVLGIIGMIVLILLIAVLHLSGIIGPGAH